MHYETTTRPDPRRTPRLALAGLGAACALGLASAALTPAPAAACGGLFCNAQTPVNQTAERILFVDHGDGTTTAAIEIMYQGAAERFAWVLPMGDIADPDNDIRVSSVQALDRLQQRTNPLYQLTRRSEGECMSEFGGDGDGDSVDFAQGSGGTFASGDGDANNGVTVEASGNVGPFDYTFISVDAGTADPAAVAVDWLERNSYEVGIGADVLRPYLQSGMKLLAVRLTKGNDVGSIRPLMITYAGSTPSIPIQPTAAAAQDDMGVMVFVGSAARAIPKNYKLLTLNDAVIDWFNFGSNYGQVVNFAADEAGGQGFVTEYANASSTMAEVVVPQWDRDRWMNFQASDFGSDQEMFWEAQQRWGAWDGFGDALGAALTLPASVSVQDVLNCANCYLDGATAGVLLDRGAFRTGLYEQTIRPMFETEDLVTAMPYFTRLYTTMSAPDMTLDPVFDNNPDMPDVDNNHTAQMVIECSPEYFFWEAPYRVELPSGLTVHGGDQNVWPLTLEDDDSIPAALSIGEVGTKGPADLIMDNQALIQAALDGAAPVRRMPGSAPGGDGDGDGSGNGNGGMQAGGDGDGAGSDGDGAQTVTACGCRTVGGGAGGPTGQGNNATPLAAGLLLGLFGLRQRRRRRG